MVHEWNGLRVISIFIVVCWPLRTATASEELGVVGRPIGEFTSLVEGSGLAGRHIFWVSFDTNSTAWIAASDGLYRYDGYSWRAFRKEDGLPSDFVRSVLVDSRGRVWFGTDSGAGVFDGKTFTILGTDKGLAGRSVRRLFEDRDGALWFSCDRWPDNSWEGGLSCLRDGVWKTYRQKDGLPADYVFNYFQDARGREYVFTGAGVVRRSGERWVPMDEPGFPADLRANEMVESKRGVAFVQQRSDEPPLLRQDGHWQTAPSGGTGPLCVTRRGEVLNVAFRNQRPSREILIQKWTGLRFEQVSSTTPCPYGSIEVIAEAPDGSVWCAGPEVLLRWLPTGSEWTVYEGLPPARLMDTRQQVWFADSQRALQRTPNGWKNVPGFHGQLDQDSGGTVWSWDGADITRWEAEHPMAFGVAQTGLTGIRGLLGDAHDGVWLYGTNAEGRVGLALYSSGEWLRPLVPEMGRRRVDAAASDPQSGIWLLASDRRLAPRALAHVSIGKPTVWYDVPPTVINYRDSGLLVDRQGVWLYGSSGLYRLLPAEGGPWTRISGLLGNNVHGALSDATRTCFLFDGRLGGSSGYAIFQEGVMEQVKADTGWFWARGRDGAYYLKSTGALLIVPRRTNSGPFHLALPEDTLVSGIVQGTSNSLWVNVPKAVLHYQPNADPPKTLLSDCDKRVRREEPLRLQLRGAKRWTVDHPQGAFLFSWRLDNGEWSPFQPPPARGIPTGSLVPGTHRIAVRCLLEGLKMDPGAAESEFVIAPVPLQERGWFPAAVVGLFGLLATSAGVALLARHKLALSASRLEDTVKERTAQLVRSNDSLRREIDERKLAEAEKERLQGQLLQAQKMESIGRLAGGIAHDFNNMLQVILGNVALSLEQAHPQSQLRADLLEILGAAERSADLTRQLLGFARKQTVSPVVLDLNASIPGVLKMLRRLVGEDIQLAWRPGEDLWPVKIDPSQLDQVLANLAVNARDAINGVGQIIIKTANSMLDPIAAQAHPDCQPGEYILLSVTDTGCGMDAETMSHVFEPFFTTKERGEGTGLGLATVYGIVKQNGGLIDIESTKGLGTTFRLYLPRAEAQAAPALFPQERPLLQGTETILFVEDEGHILDLGRRVLEKLGYTVLAAQSPEVAMDLARTYAGPIHLLVTDVVMPGMNGRELRNRLVALKPGLRCLFVSGYSSDLIAHQGVLDQGIQFLPKPFAIEALTRRVRDILDSQNPAQ